MILTSDLPCLNIHAKLNITGCTQGARRVSGTWRAVKGWPVEIISTCTHEHNLGGQPCKYFAGNALEAKIQDGRHKCLVYITFERFVQM